MDGKKRLPNQMKSKKNLLVNDWFPGKEKKARG